MPTRVAVATHGHCFDGAASAALFTALLRELKPTAHLEFAYKSCGYGPKMSHVPDGYLSGDINAILDFRFTESDKLTYYFDHHPTGFASPEERQRAEEKAAQSKGSKHVFFDPSYGSCTKLIADTAARKYGIRLDRLKELVSWAHIIDTAGFESAEAALAETPAQRVATVIEHVGDSAFLGQLIPAMEEKSLEALAKDPMIASRVEPILADQRELRKRIEEISELHDDVVFADLTGVTQTSGGKFVSYAIFPKAMYSVSLFRTKQLIKLAVGYNPWCGRERLHDISVLMKAEGGGGHPVVGAAAFAVDELERAREAAARVEKALSR